MKFLVFSDLHSHTHREFGAILKNGIHSRLYDCLNTVLEIRDYAKKHDISLVLCGGDVFHTRQHVDTSVLNLTYNAFYELSKVATILLIAGNHDQYSKDNSVISTEIFRTIPNLHLLENEIYTHQGYEFVGVPFYDDLNETFARIRKFQGAERVLLAHAEVLSASTTMGFKFEDGLRVGDLTDIFRYVFIGHIHKYQKLCKNVYIPGSPLSHNWGDVNDHKGFLEVDLDKSSVKRVYSGAPRFIETNDPSILNDRDFFRLVVDKPLKTEEIDSLREETSQLVILDTAPEEAKARSELSVSLSYEDMISRYIIERNPQLDFDKLKKLGLSCIQYDDR